MSDKHELTKASDEPSRELIVASSAPPPFASGLYQSGDGDAGEGAHLRDYWRAVRKRLWLVAGVVVVVSLLAAIHMARKPDVFVAQARVQVDLESAGPALGASKSDSIIINNPVSDPTYFNTQLQILTSPGLLRRVAKTLDLEHNRAFLAPQSAGRSSWSGFLRAFGMGGHEKTDAGGAAGKDELPVTATVAPAIARDDMAEAKRLAPYVAALQAGLRVEPVKETRTAGYIKDTRLIDVTFRHQDPQIAQKIVNTVAETFVLANLERKTDTNTSTGDFLTRRVAELQSEIRSAEERLANYAKNHQIISLDNEQNIVAERLTILNRQLLEAENERKMAEAVMRAGSDPKAATALAETSTSQPGGAKSRLDELKQQRAQLAARYQNEHPLIIEIDERIAEQQKQLTENRTTATETVTTNLETRYRQALAREESLRSALDRQRTETVTQNDAGIQYRIIQQEIETNKELLSGLLQRSRENDVVLAGTPNNISIVDYALAPDYPVGPKRTQGVMLAFVLSLAFGTGLALFLEYLNDTVRSSDEVETLLRLPTLSVIPAAGGGAVGALGRLLPVGRSSGAGLQLRGADGDGRPELLLNADQRSALAESYRHLRTSVLLSRAGQPPRTLLVSSSLPSEGKTTTSLNTAYSLAQTGASVVVVDADLRRPRLHALLGEPNTRGLSTILSSETDEADTLSMVRHNEATGLSVLTAGPVSPNPAELLGSERMRFLIATLAREYKYVVIDSPPIVSFTDAVLISPHVDGVLLVVRGGKTPRSVVRRSSQVLQEVGAKVLGVVLNNVQLQKDDYYYYRYYHAYYDAPEAEELATETHSS
jgi:polysaccharide biosynthesis transport protein